MKRIAVKGREQKSLSIEGLRALRDILFKTNVRLRIIRDLLRRRR